VRPHSPTPPRARARAPLGRCAALCACTALARSQCARGAVTVRARGRTSVQIHPSCVSFLGAFALARSQCARTAGAVRAQTRPAPPRARARKRGGYGGGVRAHRGRSASASASASAPARAKRAKRGGVGSPTAYGRSRLLAFDVRATTGILAPFRDPPSTRILSHPDFDHFCRTEAAPVDSVPAVPVRVEAEGGTERFAAACTLAMTAVQGPAGPMWWRRRKRHVRPRRHDVTDAFERADLTIIVARCRETPSRAAICAKVSPSSRNWCAFTRRRLAASCSSSSAWATVFTPQRLSVLSPSCKRCCDCSAVAPSPRA